MKYFEGDIWSLADSHWICITTNLGWTTKGLNVMGAGLARQAANRCPGLPIRYGALCRRNPGRVIVYPYKNREMWLLMCPTKGLNSEHPCLSWKQNSSLDIIKETLSQLKAFAQTSQRPIAVSAFGCANGGLYKSDVIPVMQEYLDDNFTFVEYTPY